MGRSAGWYSEFAAQGQRKHEGVFSLEAIRAGLLYQSLAAALIAVGILYAVDSGYNDGRYSAIVERAITEAPGSRLRPDLVDGEMALELARARAK